MSSQIEDIVMQHVVVDNLSGDGTKDKRARVVVVVVVVVVACDKICETHHFHVVRRLENNGMNAARRGL